MPFTIDAARAYIPKVEWHFARTMPQWPHEYTVLRWSREFEPDFLAFVALIRAAGAVKAWPYGSSEPRYHHTYLKVDAWEYWTMGEPVPETTLINRASSEPSGTVRRGSGAR